MTDNYPDTIEFTIDRDQLRRLCPDLDKGDILPTHTPSSAFIPNPVHSGFGFVPQT